MSKNFLSPGERDHLDKQELLAKGQNLKPGENIEGEQFEDTPEGHIAFYRKWLEVNSKLFSLPEVVQKLEAQLAKFREGVVQQKHEEFFGVLNGHINAGLSFDEALYNTVFNFFESTRIPKSIPLWENFSHIETSVENINQEGKKLVPQSEFDTDESRSEKLAKNKAFRELLSQLLQIQPEIHQLSEDIKYMLKYYVVQECMNIDARSFNGLSKAQVDAVKMKILDQDGEITKKQKTLLASVLSVAGFLGINTMLRVFSPDADATSSVNPLTQLEHLRDAFLSGRMDFKVLASGIGPELLAYWSKRGWLDDFDRAKNQNLSTGKAIKYAFSHGNVGAPIQHPLLSKIVHNPIFDLLPILDAIRKRRGMIFTGTALAGLILAAGGVATITIADQAKDNSKKTLAAGEATPQTIKMPNETLSDTFLDSTRNNGLDDALVTVRENVWQLEENQRAMGRQAIRGLMFEARGEAPSQAIGVASIFESKINTLVSTLAPNLKMTPKASWDESVKQVVDHFFDASAYEKKAQESEKKAQEYSQYAAKVGMHIQRLSDDASKQDANNEMKAAFKKAEEFTIIARDYRAAAESVKQEAKKTFEEIHKLTLGERKLTIMPDTQVKQHQETAQNAEKELGILVVQWQDALTELDGEISYVRLQQIRDQLKQNFPHVLELMNTFQKEKGIIAQTAKNRVREIDSRFASGTQGKSFYLSGDAKEIQLSIPEIQVPLFHMNYAIQIIEEASDVYKKTGEMPTVLKALIGAILGYLVVVLLDVVGGAGLSVWNRNRNAVMRTNIKTRLVMIPEMERNFQQLIESMETGNTAIIDESARKLIAMTSFLPVFGEIRDQLVMNKEPSRGNAFSLRNKGKEVAAPGDMKAMRDLARKYAYKPEFMLNDLRFVQEWKPGEKYDANTVVFIPKPRAATQYIHIKNKDGSFSIRTESSSVYKEGQSLFVNMKGIFAVQSREITNKDGERELVPHIIDVIAVS